MKLSAWRDDVDIGDARRLLQELVKSHRDRDELWNRIEPYLVHGDELTAQYAFLDLWEFSVWNELNNSPKLPYSAIVCVCAVWFRNDSCQHQLECNPRPNTGTPACWQFRPRLQNYWRRVKIKRLPLEQKKLVRSANLSSCFVLWNNETPAYPGETQAPEPMRKRRLFAPPNFLEFA